MLYDAITLGQIRKILEMGHWGDGVTAWCLGKRRSIQLQNQLILTKHFNTYLSQSSKWPYEVRGMIPILLIRDYEEHALPSTVNPFEFGARQKWRDGVPVGAKLAKQPREPAINSLGPADRFIWGTGPSGSYWSSLTAFTLVWDLRSSPPDDVLELPVRTSQSPEEGSQQT